MTWAAPSPRQPVGAVPGLQFLLVAIGVTTILVIAGIALLVAVGPWPGDLAARSPRDSVLAILPGDATGRALTTADADAVVKTVPGVTLISRMVFGTARVGVGNQGPPTVIQAVDASYALSPDVQLARGAFFTSEDATAANRVAVLGARAASTLFGGAQSSIGQAIRIDDLPFTVVGVLAGQADASESSAVLIPFQTGQIRLFGATGLGEVLLQVRDASQTQAIIPQVQQVLRMRHQTRAGQADSFTISTAPSVSTPAVQFVDRLQYLSRQVACQAKTLCAAIP